MTKVEIDGKTYCVETLIYNVERLTREVKASAEHHRLVLDKIMAEIEEILGEYNYNLDDYDFCSGLICARKIIDKYRKEPEK